MSGLFGDLDIASAKENPFFKPDGAYHCSLTSAEIKIAKSGSKGFALEYTIQSGDKKNKKIQEWKSIPMPWNLKGYESEAAMNVGGPSDDEINGDGKIKERAEREMSFLKRRLKDFGIPVEEMNSVDREYLLNKVPDLEITIKNSGDNERITGIKLWESDSSSDPFSN